MEKYVIRLWTFTVSQVHITLHGNEVDADVENRHTRPPDVNYGAVDEEFASPSSQ